MRMAIIVILTIIVTSMLCAQIDPPLYAPEFYIHVKNATPNTTIHFTLEKFLSVIVMMLILSQANL